MATYTLSGSGSQVLSASTTALHVTITTLPAGAGAGSAKPTNYYAVGAFRFGDGTAFWEPLFISGGPQWFGLPNGTTVLDYAIFGSGVVTVTEVIGGVSPFVGPAGPAGSTGATGATGAIGPAGPSGVGDYVRIATVLVSGSVLVTASFASIPGTYRHLQLRGVFRTDRANTFDTLALRFNSDSGVHYDSLLEQASPTFGTLVESLGSSSMQVAGGNGASSAAGDAGTFVLDIAEYAAAWTKTLVGRGTFHLGSGSGSTRAVVGAGKWASTAAITQIDLLSVNGANLAIGSEISLYGIN